jgi:hypothetical protein
MWAMRIALGKTAGPAEEEAWAWLMDKIRMHCADQNGQRRQA